MDCPFDSRSVFGSIFYICLSKKRRKEAIKTLTKFKYRVQLFCYSPAFISLIDKRINVIGKLVDVELEDISQIDKTR